MNDQDAKDMRLQAVLDMSPVKHHALASKASGIKIGQRKVLPGIGVAEVVGYWEEHEQVKVSTWLKLVGYLIWISAGIVVIVWFHGL